MTKILSLVVGGAAGTLARYFLTQYAGLAFGTSFPYGTIAVNLLGCFLIGFLASLASGRNFLSPETSLLLMAGFCGAFTTFSTFILETDALLKNGGAFKALLNVLFSVIFGFIVFRLGVLAASGIGVK